MKLFEIHSIYSSVNWRWIVSRNCDFLCFEQSVEMTNDTNNGSIEWNRHLKEIIRYFQFISSQQLVTRSEIKQHWAFFQIEGRIEVLFCTSEMKKMLQGTDPNECRVQWRLFFCIYKIQWILKRGSFYLASLFLLFFDRFIVICAKSTHNMVCVTRWYWSYRNTSYYANIDIWND